MISQWESAIPHLQGCVVLIPVKAFEHAKARLAPTLDAKSRSDLARTMAGRVLAAAVPLPVAVVCDDSGVAKWAEERGAIVLPEPGRGLDGAVTSGVARLAEAGASEVLVAHADLPFASGLAALAGYEGITLVPDRHLDGTNVVCIPAASGFQFAYGQGSFARHKVEAERLGLGLRIIDEPLLAWDVDVPDDLYVGLGTSSEDDS